MLSKNELARRIEEVSGIKPNLAKSVMDAISAIAAEELEAGEDFTVPGVVRIAYYFAPARTKGGMYKKGDTVQGPQGERVAEADSKARKASVRIKALAAPSLTRFLPKRNDAAGQSKWLSTRAGRAMKARKAR